MILFTDSSELYANWKDEKILTDGFIILASNFIEESRISLFNAQLNGSENEAAELMIKELEAVCSQFPEIKTNRFLATRKSNYDKAYSLLYADFKDFVLKKYLIENLVKATMEVFEISASFQFNFSADYQSLNDSKFISANGTLILRPGQSAPQRSFKKNAYYLFKKLKRNWFEKIKPVKAKYHLCLFFFDTINDIELFRTFFELVKNDPEVHLTIVQIESGIPLDKASSANIFAGKNISFFKFQDFRAPQIKGHNDFNRILRQSYPQYNHFINSQSSLSSITYSAFMDAALKELKPNCVLYDNTGEVGRYLSDVARFHKIPSSNVEYGLFSNDFMHMASNICFDIRFCLGEESIKTWKNKKDPTHKHLPIGFIKLDHNAELTGSDVNFEWTNNFEKRIFFASTWSGSNSLYNTEKTIVVRELSEVCKRNNWALIIKKHPAEYDTLLEDLPETKENYVFLYQHHDAQLFQLLSACEVICTQNSSITVEALLHNKPTVFYNKSNLPGLAELVPISKEPFVYFVHDNIHFEQIVKQEIPLLEDALFEKSKAKYLFKADQNASLRLLEELKKIC